MGGIRKRKRNRKYSGKMKRNGDKVKLHKTQKTWKACEYALRHVP